MRLPGILRSWNDDRGFGFIAPTHGGAELYVHISAFPRDGSRPVEGESVTYELGRGQNGKPQAVRVLRQAIGRSAPRRAAQVARSGSLGLSGIAMSAVLILALAAYGYSRFVKPERPAPAPAAVASEIVESGSPQAASYRCDGRTYCTQMTSCAEATYFLKNCPGVKMDGNHDGVPCEQQWCR